MADRDQPSSSPQGSPHAQPAHLHLAPPPLDLAAQLQEAQLKIDRMNRDGMALMAKNAQLEAERQAFAGRGVGAPSAAAGSAPAPADGRPVNRSAKAPPMTKFAGTVGQEVDTWIRNLNVQYKFHGPREFPDAQARIDYAVAYMEGVAADWWAQQEVHLQGAGITWEQFVEALHGRFRPLQASAVARRRLAGLKQRGSVSQYCSQFQAIMALIPDMSPADQVFRFIEGLQEKDVRIDALKNNPKTLSEAMDVAVRAEAYLGRATSSYHPSSGFHRGFGTPASSSSSVPMDVNALDAYPEDDNLYDTGLTTAGPVGMEERMQLQILQLEARLNRSQAQQQHLAALLHHGSAGRAAGAPAASAAAMVNTPNNQGTKREGRGRFSAEKERLYNEGRCFKCKKTGHQSRDCTTEVKKVHFGQSLNW